MFNTVHAIKKPSHVHHMGSVGVQAAPRPRRFKETTNSKWDDYYEAESPPSYPHLQRISSARQGSYSDKALLLLSGACIPSSLSFLTLLPCKARLSLRAACYSAMLPCQTQLLCQSEARTHTPTTKPVDTLQCSELQHPANIAALKTCQIRCKTTQDDGDSSICGDLAKHKTGPS